MGGDQDAGLDGPGYQGGTAFSYDGDVGAAFDATAGETGCHQSREGRRGVGGFSALDLEHDEAYYETREHKEADTAPHSANLFGHSVWGTARAAIWILEGRRVSSELVRGSRTPGGSRRQSGNFGLTWRKSWR